MAKLKDIKGSAIQYLEEDPIEYVGTWASSTSINTARAFGNGAGTTNANLYYGGSAAPTYYDNTESWNGTSWTEGNNLNTARYSIANRGAGTQTAGLCAGGRERGGSSSYYALTEEYNGTSWSEVNDMPAGVESATGLGTQTAAGVWGGYTGSYRATGLLYDGTNWTSTTDFPFPSGSASEAGSTTAGLLFGIFNDSIPGYVTNTVSWDGTAFTEENDLSTARGGGGGPKANLNTSSSALMVSGKTDPGSSAATEEWSFPPSTSTIVQEGQLWFNYSESALKGYGKAAGIPAGTWSSGGSLNVARSALTAAGTTYTNSIAMQGEVGPPSTYEATAEEYNGSTWSNGGDMNTARAQGAASKSGSQTATLTFVGRTAPGAVANNESYNGSAWTEVGDVNTAVRAQPGGTGTLTAALKIAGAGPPIKQNVESWDGSSWTEIADLNEVKFGIGSAGIQTASLVFGGAVPAGPGLTTNTEQWDGSSWTELANMNTAREYVQGAGTSTLALGFSGSPPTTGKTETWNGTSWTEVNDLSSARSSSSGSASALSALCIGGNTPPYSAATEEWEVGNAVSTVTTS